MNDNDISKYIASFDDVLTQCGNDKFLAQKHYFTQPTTREMTFDPFLFFASNIKDLLEKAHIVRHKHRVTEIPKIVTIDAFTVLERGKANASSLTDMFIHARMRDYQYSRDSFDQDAYMSQHYESVRMYSELYPEREITPARFYVEYGYWYGIDLQHVDGIRYIASNPEFIHAVDENVALTHYFNNKRSISFNPYLYTASNWSILKPFVDTKTGNVNAERVTKHYIAKGCSDGLPINSFDHWNYLANSVPSIMELLCKPDGNTEWNFMRLTPTRAAKLFIRKGGVVSDSFDASEFVKLYVGDYDEVNVDRKLNVENAAYYFVKGYVTNPTVRWRTTYRYAVLDFLRNRMFDMIRQMPIHIGRCLVFSR